jgi:hypothetical protein
LLKTEEPVTDNPEQQTEKNPGIKKQFIEPEITTPVDVLEATTFFQTVSSGATN